jgi:hypothetical protein
MGRYWDIRKGRESRPDGGAVGEPEPALELFRGDHGELRTVLFEQRTYMSA